MRLVVLAAILAAAGSADAYPQFQLATGARRCNQCHYAPAGGGLINGYGRGEAGETISMGGNGAFLHGAWSPPPWLALGADLRVAALANGAGGNDGPEFAAFPMQADLYARVERGSLSLYVSAGLDGSARSHQPGFVSREHYLMWRKANVGPYVRLGRFFAPYGLRLAEHPLFVRRFLGFDILEETYNLSGGWVGDDWELHATAFTPDFITQPVGHRGSGGALYYERRFGARAAAGAQARVSVASIETRAQAGLVGKLYLDGPRLLLLGEADLVHSSFADLDATRLQCAAYLGLSWTVMRGLMAQLMVERWDEDLAQDGVARDAVDLQLQWFATAHVEVSLFGRLQVIGNGDADGASSKVLLFQAHYYL